MRASYREARRREELKLFPPPAAASGAGFGGAQPPSSRFWASLMLCFGDVLRPNARSNMHRGPTCYPRLCAKKARADKMLYAESAAETSGSICPTCAAFWPDQGLQRARAVPSASFPRSGKSLKPWPGPRCAAPVAAPNIGRWRSATSRPPGAVRPPPPLACGRVCSRAPRAAA